MTILLYLALFILLALSIVIWAAMAISGRCSREEEAGWEIDEHQLEGDLRHDLRDISFGGRG